MNLDPVKALMEGIGKRESGGSYSAIGKPTSTGDRAYGKYQIMGANIPSWSKQYYGQSLTPEQYLQNPAAQDAVAHGKMSDDYKQYGNLSDVASVWFSGRPLAEAGNASDVNGTTTPDYVKEVLGNINSMFGGGVADAATLPNTQSSQQAPKQPLTHDQMVANINALEQQGASQDEIQGYLDSLKSSAPSGEAQGADGASQGGFQPDYSLIPKYSNIGDELVKNLSGRLDTLGQAGNMLTSPGGTQFPSGVLQGAGAFAGGVGDVLNAGFQAIPGVRALEQGLQAGLGDLAQTPMGQNIVSGLSQFAQAHPEAAGDISAVANLASLIPLYKGLSLTKAGLGDTVSSVVKGDLKDAATAEIGSNLTRSALSDVKDAEARNLDPIGYLLSNPETLPGIAQKDTGVGFKYSTEDAQKAVQSSLDKDEQQLESLLQVNAPNSPHISLESARQKVLADVASAFKLKGGYTDAVRGVNKYFDSVKSSDPRDFISLNDLNQLKRDVRGNAFEGLGYSDQAKLKKIMGSSLRKQVEDGASASGIQGVDTLNKQMGEKIEALSVLESLEGRTVRQTLKGKFLKELGTDMAGGAGEALGNVFGVPFAGTLAARGLRGLVSSEPKTALMRLLNRVQRGGPATSINQGLLKIARGVGQQKLGGLVNPQQ